MLRPATARSCRARAAPSLTLLPWPLHDAQTPDAKKEEFRRYLERSGVIDALTKGARWQRSSRLARIPSALRL